MLNKYNYHNQLGLYLKPNTKATIDEILKYVNNKGIAFPSLETIAGGINIHARTVQRHIRVIKDIKVGNGLPFMIVYRKRSARGEFSHNVYYFPWLDGDKWKDYIRQHHKSIINALIEEYSQKLIEEYQSHTTEESQNQKEDRVGLFSIHKLVKSLSKITEIGIGEAMRVLISVAERIDRGDLIFNLDKYLIKSLKLGKKQEDVKKILQKMYQALLPTGQDGYSIDWSSFANTLLT